MAMSRPSFGDIKPPYAVYRIWLWRWPIYLTTIKRRLIGGFPQARLADVINRTRPIGPGNRRTTQFLYKSDLSLSMTLKTEEDIFSLIMYFVYSRKKEWNMWFSNMCACVSLALHYFSMSSPGFRPNKMARPVGRDSPPIFAALQWSSKKKGFLVRGRCIWLNDAYSKDMPPGLYTKEEQQSCRIIKRTSCMLMQTHIFVYTKGHSVPSLCAWFTLYAWFFLKKEGRNWAWLAGPNSQSRFKKKN